MSVGSGKAVKIPESEWIKIPDHHPAIIDKAVFYAAREKINQKGEPLRKRELGTWERYKNIRSPVQGKVFCGCCGHTMKLSSTKNAAFHCDFTRAATDAPCYRSKILEADLSDIILDMIRQRVSLNRDATENNSVSRSQPEQEYERLISKCRKEKQMLYERFVKDEISAEGYKSEKTVLDAESDRLSQAYAALKKTAAARTSDKQLRELMEAAASENTLTIELVDLLIDRVRVYPDGRVDIQWKLTGGFTAYGN